MSAECEKVTDYFQSIDPASFKKPVEDNCHPARIHDAPSPDTPGNEVGPKLICFFDHQHFNGLAAGHQFEAENDSCTQCCAGQRLVRWKITGVRLPSCVQSPTISVLPLHNSPWNMPAPEATNSFTSGWL